MCSAITHGAQRGYVVYHEEAPPTAPVEEETLFAAAPCLVATTVDAPRYHNLLQSRVQQAVRKASENH